MVLLSTEEECGTVSSRVKRLRLHHAKIVTYCNPRRSDYLIYFCCFSCNMSNFMFSSTVSIGIENDVSTLYKQTKGEFNGLLKSEFKPEKEKVRTGIVTTQCFVLFLSILTN